MNNQKTIQAIEDKFSAAIEPLKKQTVRKEINFRDIEINDSKLYFQDTPLSKIAQRKILNELQVKSGFINYSEKLEDRDWEMISKKLKDAQGDRVVYGNFETDSENKEIIQNVFGKKQDKPAADPEDYDFFINSITESLGKSEIEYDLGSFNFDQYRRIFDLSLLNRESSIDIFKDGKDIWDGGHSFTFNTSQFSTSPFFERLVCTNGMRSRQNMFSSSINQSKFNIKKISRLIEKNILDGTESLNEAIMIQANHLIKNNISINEFDIFRKKFITSDEEKQQLFEKIRNQYFDDKPFYKAYRENIAEKSKKWRSTANSGINAYQFFNMLTWLGSHQKETGLSDTVSRDIQLSASNLFFKENLDLEDVAGNVNVDYPVNDIAFA